MWRSVLLCGFPEHDNRSLQGLPGSLAPSSLTVSPSGSAVLIAPGRSLHYVLDTPLVDVIGVSCRLRLLNPGRAVSSSLRILRLGDGFELSLEPLTRTRAMVRVRLRGVRHDLGQLPNPTTRFAELGFDWHTNGNTYLRVDGRLVGYHDALGRWSKLVIEDVAFGSPESVPAATDPHYELGQFYVRALSRRTLSRPRWPRRRSGTTQPLGPGSPTR